MTVLLVAVAAALTACAMPEQSSTPDALSAMEPTSAGQGLPAQANVQRLVANAPGAIATSREPSAVSVPLAVVDGMFLGIGVGSFLSEALSVLGVAAVVEHAGAERPSDIGVTLSPCSAASDDHWVMRANGLTLLFEGPSAAEAQLTNWVYVGGPASGFTEMVAPNGLTIGGTRRTILSAYKQSEDLGDAIDVSEPVNLRFGLQGDSIIWFGGSDCGG